MGKKPSGRRVNEEKEAAVRRLEGWRLDALCEHGLPLEPQNRK